MKIKQRGSKNSIQLVFTLYKLFGYKFIYYFIYLVTFFYFIFASNIKKSLKIFYKKADIPFTSLVYYNHLRMFAITMIDRFISKYKPNVYTFTYDENKNHSEILNKKCIILFSHFGGWASASNKPISNNKIHIVMQESLLSGIKDIENSIKKKVDNTNIIDLEEGPLSVSIKIANALSDNEIIAIMADRASNKKYKYKTNFLGESAYFNENPFKIAYKTKTPILCYFVIYKSQQKYHVQVNTLEINYKLNEKEAINTIINEYSRIFEDLVKKYPNQWFNFYDFWRK